ncbi:hypothetical protein [Duganella aceris]|uniref:Cupin domain-containing protein n=1 Tax=Duganella aceris TaxID=2703883 RepID=A0ABX0FHD3_9BURK|nr:hypothetical protein [Duganella aceris]NGZ83995.1 hypothetical protein [Duganella aceris]
MLAFRLALVASIFVAASSAAMAQATSRSCDADSLSDERPGPACLIARRDLGDLGGQPVYWGLYTYPTMQAARQDSASGGEVIAAFGKIWLFTVGAKSARALHGEHVAEVGPVSVSNNTAYAAEFLKSTFSPGMTAPIHVHSGPEAFYAVSGETCLETPDGVQVGRGAGNSLIVQGGPPMLLMALGHEPRKGFAMILHDAALPPTTLVHDWTPKGLCQAEMPK